MPDARTFADRCSRIFTLIFLACIAILGFALYLQHVEKLYPCPLCIIQRLLFMAVGMICLVGALHRPGAGMATFYSMLGAATSLGGAAVAGYQIYLQADEARASACTGSAVERFLDQTDIGSWIPPLLQYDGPCTLAPWKFLWLSIPEWSLICFVALCVVLAFTPRVASR